MGTRAALALVSFSLLGAAILELLVTPERHVPIIELVPILIAASVRSPLPVPAVALAAFALHLFSAYLSGFPWETTAFGSIALLAAAYLALLLARQREEAERGQREAARAHAHVTGVLESISDAFFALDSNWCFTYANREAERLLQRARDTLIGRCIWEEFPEAVGTAFYEQYQRVARERVPVAFVEHYQPLGKCFEVHAYPAPDGISVYFHDVTERVRVEAEREQALAELEATIAAIPDAVMIYDPHGAIRRANPAASAIVGLNAEDFARPIAERTALLHIERADGTPLAPGESPAMRALRGETVRGIDLVLHPPAGGTVWVSASAAPILAGDGRMLGAVQTLVDVTAQRRLTEQRDDFVRAISHDLRQPLTVVLGQAELLLSPSREETLDPRVGRGLKAILASARRMNAMIGDLVDSVRLEAGQLALKPEPVDLVAFITELKDRMAANGEAERVRLEATAGLPRALADPAKLERVVGNLLSNALKYSSPGSPVEITVTGGSDELVVTVRDRGPGIASEDLPHVFDRYFRSPAARHRSREGLGLGLYIVKGLVEAHGGRVWVESAASQGSSFSFSLPPVKA